MDCGFEAVRRLTTRGKHTAPAGQGRGRFAVALRASLAFGSFASAWPAARQLGRKARTAFLSGVPMSTVVELSPPVHVATPDAPREYRASNVRPAARLSELDAALFDGVGGLIDSVLDRCMWAEDEIEAAQLRHGERDRGPLWNSFRLLKPTHERAWPELVYRAHCRELLDRVAAGLDTQPATDAEKIAVLSAASQAAPLNSGAETLYLRIGTRMLPDVFESGNIRVPMRR
jgi:hypothetical protein